MSAIVVKLNYFNRIILAVARSHVVSATAEAHEEYTLWSLPRKTWWDYHGACSLSGRSPSWSRSAWLASFSRHALYLFTAPLLLSFAL